MFESIKSVLVVISIIAVGVIAAGQPWFGKTGSDFLAKLTVNFLFPFYMTYNVMTTFSSLAEFLSAASKILIPAASIASLLLIGSFLAKLLKIPAGRKGLFINVFSLANIVVIGFPVCEILFGSESAVFGILFYTANTLLFWTFGNYLLSRDGDIRAGRRAKIFSLATLKNILSPPLLGFFAGVLLVLTETRLPFVLFETVHKIALSSTPISLLFVGSILRGVDLKKIKLDKEMIMMLLGRFLLAPLFIFLLLSALGGPVLMRQVFFILSAMPAMTQLSIMCRIYGADYEYAAIVTTVTTVLSLVLIPVYMLIVSSLPIFQ